jgi:hypothetical protein
MKGPCLTACLLRAGKLQQAGKCKGQSAKVKVKYSGHSTLEHQNVKHFKHLKPCLQQASLQTLPNP